ncbi:MAG: enoyl-CoA hydratase-related protein [Burkholderiaceae bacterium]
MNSARDRSSSPGAPLSDDESPVRWHVEHGVGHLVMNRPGAANALDLRTGVALAEAVDRIAIADVGAVLISSTGRQFCAGGDIGEFVAHRERLDALVAEMLAALHPAMRRLAGLRCPVVSAVQGAVGGAGIGLALCADIVLASTAMKLRGGYSAIGLSPDLGTSYYLARRAGAARAKYVLMTNRAIPAQTCLQWGLVDELHEPDALEAAAATLARELAAGARASLSGIKRLCDGAGDHGLAAHLDLEREQLLRRAASADAAEGVQAFIDKRAPSFGDRPAGSDRD